jgi:hypothetical protein
VFKRERTLFVRVAFHASGICSVRESSLFRFKAAVLIMTIAAFDCAFEDAMMKGLGKLRSHFGVTFQT